MSIGVDGLHIRQEGVLVSNEFIFLMKTFNDPSKEEPSHDTYAKSKVSPQLCPR